MSNPSPTCSPLLKQILDKPSYGWESGGTLVIPTHRQILGEFAGRMNIFKTRRNWLPLLGWTLSLSLAVPLTLFFTQYFTWPLALIGFVYSMVLMGSHGTFWLHRYGTHRAFRFRNRVWRDVCRNLVIKIIPEEIYIVSHHVHHVFSEKPGDPYNVHGGWLYCFLADANHQMLNPNLTAEQYSQVTRLVLHTGMKVNSYAEYQRWGTLAHPLRTVIHYALNWGLWYAAFYLIGGHALAITIFGWAGVWGIGVRTYNYDGHGGGKDKRQDGIDFNREDLSVNQVWPGYVAGEWHNNHHLYPTGARSGFLPYQLDLPWLAIWTLHRIGAISSYQDFKAQFVAKYITAPAATTPAAPLSPPLRAESPVL